VSYAPTTLAYLAGIIDGEGCFKATAHKHRNGSTNMQILMAVSNTSWELMVWLQSTFGGKVVVRKKHATHLRQQWAWHLYATDLVRLLPDLLPFMVIKRTQAELTLEWAALAERCWTGKKSNPRRLEIVYEIQACNRGGG
jgi:hypothetical protein